MTQAILSADIWAKTCNNLLGHEVDKIQNYLKLMRVSLVSNNNLRSGLFSLMIEKIENHVVPEIFDGLRDLSKNQNFSLRDLQERIVVLFAIGSGLPDYLRVERGEDGKKFLVDGQSRIEIEDRKCGSLITFFSQMLSEHRSLSYQAVTELDKLDLGLLEKGMQLSVQNALKITPAGVRRLQIAKDIINRCFENRFSNGRIVKCFYLHPSAVRKMIEGNDVFAGFTSAEFADVYANFQKSKFSKSQEFEQECLEPLFKKALLKLSVSDRIKVNSWVLLKKSGECANNVQKQSEACLRTFKQTVHSIAFLEWATFLFIKHDFNQSQMMQHASFQVNQTAQQGTVNFIRQIFSDPWLDLYGLAHGAAFYNDPIQTSVVHGGFMGVISLILVASVPLQSMTGRDLLEGKKPMLRIITGAYLAYITFLAVSLASQERTS